MSVTSWSSMRIDLTEYPSGSLAISTVYSSGATLGMVKAPSSWAGHRRPRPAGRSGRLRASMSGPFCSVRCRRRRPDVRSKSFLRFQLWRTGCMGREAPLSGLETAMRAGRNIWVQSDHDDSPLDKRFTVTSCLPCTRPRTRKVRALTRARLIPCNWTPGANVERHGRGRVPVRPDSKWSLRIRRWHSRPVHLILKANTLDAGIDVVPAGRQSVDAILAQIVGILRLRTCQHLLAHAIAVSHGLHCPRTMGSLFASTTRPAITECVVRRTTRSLSR